MKRFGLPILMLFFAGLGSMVIFSLTGDDQTEDMTGMDQL
jgi:hypothetical protein